MFKPVKGDALQNYDAETIELYKKRDNDPRLSYVLSVVARPARNNLPVIVDGKNNSYLQQMESANKNFVYNYFALFTFFGKQFFLMKVMLTHLFKYNIAFGAHQFTKAYYPYGIIARRSVPTTPLKQLSYFGPICAFWGYCWWMHKEYPRSQRVDLTSDSE